MGWSVVGWGGAPVSAPLLSNPVISEETPQLTGLCFLILKMKGLDDL